jgi:transcriptional regulator with XRE-family HTH domain
MEASELRRLIKRRGWTQRKAAAVIGVHESAVSLWLSGKRPIPSPVERLLALLKENAR